MKFKIIHLHTDIKFLFESKIFESNFFINTSFFIQNNDNNEILPNSVIGLNNTDNDINRIINECNKADLIVLWCLSGINQKIALSLDKNVKIAWRFFGYELYSKLPEFLFTQTTLKVINGGFKGKIKKVLLKNNFTKRIIEMKDFKSNELFYESIKRINYFIGLFHEEYIYLSKYFVDLPLFINSPMKIPEKRFEFNKPNPTKIILGHNGHALNNHIDILKLIGKATVSNANIFYMLMSYGGNSRYGKKVKIISHKISQVRIVEKMMPLDEFKQFYNDIGAFVLNAHRQSGVGNIFIGFHYGVKIYLNKNNITLQWLKNEGFIIFTIEDFEEDLKNNNLILAEKDALHNYNNCFKLAERNSIEMFQKKIAEYLENRN